MSDIFLLGGMSALIAPDSLDNFHDASSIESGVKLDLRGRMVVAGSPVGERVFRRLYVTVIHTNGCAFYATPIIDDVELTALRSYFSRPAPGAGSEERHVFMLPMGKTHTLFPNVRVGVCGTVAEARIDMTDPTNRFHVENVYFALDPINQGRAKAANE